MAQTWDIWAEGYAATGDSGSATNLASNVTADSFAEACVFALGNSKLFDPARQTFWGCKLFSNRHDAQKAYG